MLTTLSAYSANPHSFGRDHHLRQRLFTPTTFQHKARVNLYWLAWLLDHYTAQGQPVLDPFGGAGSILLAALKSRPVLSGDVEPHWAALQNQNALHIRSSQLFVSPVLTCQWNALHLPLPNATFPAILTSPPYFDTFSNWNRKSGHALDGQHVHPCHGLSYGDAKAQVGNIHVYEHYLRVMRAAYRECKRVLTPGGILVLIVGDRVRRKRRVPITADTRALCQAQGLTLLATHQRAVIPSQFRNIHVTRDPSYPRIEDETALVFQNQNPYWPRPQRRFAIVQAPRPNSSPGQQLFTKALACARLNNNHVLILTQDGLCPEGNAGPNPLWSGDHAKARARQDYACTLARDLVAKHTLTGGDLIELHVSLSYARYLARRLATLGCHTTIPTARLNLGQKLQYYTRALEQAQT
jgi:SAM-dependent methyltransferase